MHVNSEAHFDTRKINISLNFWQVGISTVGVRGLDQCIFQWMQSMYMYIHAGSCLLKAFAVESPSVLLVDTLN